MTSYPYATGVIKSLSNKLLDRAKLYRFQSLDQKELLKALNDAGYGTSYNSLEDLINSEFLKLKDIMKVNSPNTRFTNLFFIQADIENVTVLYKCKIFHLPVPNLNPNGMYDSNLLKDAILNKKVTDNEGINNLVNALNKATSGIVSSKLISRLIDDTIYSEAIRITKGNKALKTYYKLKVDTTNILTFMRMKRLNWNVDQFKSLSLNGGLIKLDYLASLYSKTSEELIKGLAGYYDEALSKILRAYFTNNDISSLEISLEQLVLTRMKEFENDVFDFGPTLYYILSKEAEAKNIRMIYSSENLDINQLLDY